MKNKFVKILLTMTTVIFLNMFSISSNATQTIANTNSCIPSGSSCNPYEPKGAPGSCKDCCSGDFIPSMRNPICS